MNSYFNFKFTTLTLAIAGVLTGCGGGGSSGSGGGNDTYTGYLRSGVSYHTPIRVGTYDPLVGSGYYIPVDDIFVRDLNSNGIDEVIFGGRMTPAPSASDWKSYQMQIYGWNQGAFNNETARWFSGNDNQIIGQNLL